MRWRCYGPWHRQGRAFSGFKRQTRTRVGIIKRERPGRHVTAFDRFELEGVAPAVGDYDQVRVGLHRHGLEHDPVAACAHLPRPRIAETYGRLFAVHHFAFFELHQRGVARNRFNAVHLVHVIAGAAHMFVIAARIGRLQRPCGGRKRTPSTASATHLSFKTRFIAHSLEPPWKARSVQQPSHRCCGSNPDQP